MPQSISCPNCGSALDYDGVQPVVHCASCGSSITVPEARRSSNVGGDPLVPDPSLSEVAALLRAGQRVKATILYREITGAALKDARIAIDRFMAGEPLRRPNLMGG